MNLIIIGTGKMARALAEGLARSYSFTLAGRTQSRAEDALKAWGITAQAAAIETLDVTGSTLLLGVKPYALSAVAGQLRGKAQTLHSILAGTPLGKLRANIDAEHYVRAMPNLAAGHLASMTTLCGDAACKEEALLLFDTIGSTLWVESEKELDIATAIAGSGPAFLALVAEALSDGGVKAGLKRSNATLLTEGLFKGFSGLLAVSHPALIKDAVMSPAGTTAAGIKALEQEGVRHAFMEAVEAAFTKTQTT